jgi:hypothetical protein
MSAESEAAELAAKAAAAGADDAAKAAAGGWNWLKNNVDFGGIKKFGGWFTKLPKAKSGKIAPVRTLLKAGGILGGGALLGKSLLGGGGEGPVSGDQLDFSAMGTGTGAQDKYRQLLADIASGKLSAGGGGGAGGGGANYGAMANMANQAGGASIAAMQRLANQAAGTAAGISAEGTASADALRRIYGDAASQITQASRMAGTPGSSLTPVSGTLAMLPKQVQQAGGTMADFLKANQLVAAQDAGFLSELANTQAPNYATQFARQDAVFRMADMARRQAAARAAATSGRDAQIQAMLQLAKYDAENPAPTPLLSTDPQAIQDEWNKATQLQKQQWKSMGINNVNDYYKRKTQAAAEAAANLG